MSCQTSTWPLPTADASGTISLALPPLPRPLFRAPTNRRLARSVVRARLGRHQESCAPGGGLVFRHDRTAHAVAAMARRGKDSQPRLEQVLPQLTERAKGEIAQLRMDVVAYDGTARMLIDVVIVSPLAGDPPFCSLLCQA